MQLTGVISGVPVKYDTYTHGPKDNILVRRVVIWLRLPVKRRFANARRLGCIHSRSGFVSKCRGRRRKYNRIIGCNRV